MADMSDSRVIEMFDGIRFPTKRSEYTSEQERQLKSYIVEIMVKVRMGSTRGEIQDTGIKVHKKIAGTVQEIFAEVAQNNNVYVIDSHNMGGYHFRGMKVIRNGRPVEIDTLSIHSSGLAIDVNTTANTQTSNRHEADTETKMRTTNHPFVKAFMSRGFDWGGLWNSGYDPMHFEFTSKGGNYTPSASTNASPVGNNDTGTTVNGGGGGTYVSREAPYTPVEWAPPIEGGEINFVEELKNNGIGRLGMVVGVHIRQKNIYGRKGVKTSKVISPKENL